MNWQTGLRFHGFLLFLFVLVITQNFALDKTPSPEPSPSPSASEKDLAVSRNLEEARQALSFGVDSTVIAVIREAATSKDERIKAEIAALINSPNQEVQTAVMDYFASLKDYSLILEAVCNMVTKFESIGDKTYIRALSLIEDAKPPVTPELTASLYDLAKTGTKTRQNPAIHAIGILTVTDAAKELKDLFSRSGLSIETRTTIVQAIGNKKDPAFLPFFKEIIEDTAEDKELRRSALVAVGQLADQTGLPIIKKAIVSTDLFERKAAANALEGYPLKDVEDLYSQALRDSVWQNRVAVIRQISTKGYASFSSAIAYMALHDPEVPVRSEAMHCLVVLDSSWDKINSIILDAKSPSDVRINAIAEGLKKSPTKIMGSISGLLDQEWKNEKSHLIEAIARELSTADVDASAVYERLLKHSQILIQTWAVRGIQHNKLSSFKPELQSLLDKKPDVMLRSALEDALK